MSIWPIVWNEGTLLLLRHLEVSKLNYSDSDFLPEQ